MFVAVQTLNSVWFFSSVFPIFLLKRSHRIKTGFHDQCIFLGLPKFRKSKEIAVKITSFVNEIGTFIHSSLQALKITFFSTGLKKCDLLKNFKTFCNF